MWFESEQDLKREKQAINTFVEKFNKKYDSGLLEEQKTLLNYYISSFSDNSLTLKTFLNDEILRLKESLKTALSTKEIASDKEMIRKTNDIILKLNSFYQQELNETILLTILKTQQLVKELTNDANHG